MPSEYVFTTNNFKRPKKMEGREAISTFLIRLILMEPGTDQARPNMGVGLVSRYRYTEENSITDLKNDITKQIQMYLPNFQSVEVDIEVNIDKSIILNILVDNVLYKYESDKQKDNKIGLTDLL